MNTYVVQFETGARTVRVADDDIALLRKLSEEGIIHDVKYIFEIRHVRFVKEDYE